MSAGYSLPRMLHNFSLTAGLGQVNKAYLMTPTAPAVSTHCGKLLQRLTTPRAATAGLKPGANEMDHRASEPFILEIRADMAVRAPNCT